MRTQMPESTALRELFEETGMRIDASRLEKTGVVVRGAAFFVIRLVRRVRLCARRKGR